MKTALDISIVIVTFAMMVAVGMGLEARHFAEVARRKRIAAAALIGQMVPLPVIGWCIAHVVALPPHLSAGILLMAACPVGDIANFYTALARANTALSVAVNTLSCLLAAVTMAIVFELYARLSGERFMFAAPPLERVARVVLLTAVPVAAGMVLRRLIPRVVARMDVAINIALGSSIQIALFVAPVLVFLSYFIAPAPMNLIFTILEVVAIALTVVIIAFSRTASRARESTSTFCELRHQRSRYPSTFFSGPPLVVE